MAVSKAVGSLGRGTKWTALEKLSIMDHVLVLPSDGGRMVTKSTAIWDQGHFGIGKGQRRPVEGWCEALLRAQTEQAATKSHIIVLLCGA